VFDQDLPTIATESQADCAAGAWAKYALDGQAAHFRDVTPADLDEALEGFLDGRDSTPGTPADVSHGNGFDRLSALADGIDKGATYCYSDGYFDSRTFTERPFATQADYDAGGNTPIDEVLKPGDDNLFVNDLNRFWTEESSSVSKTFTPVEIAEADHPPCAPDARFGYCPDDNTVYYDDSFAHDAYFSLPDVASAGGNGNVRLVFDQPADFALGVLFAIGWGMAVRHQLFDRSLNDSAALESAICYTGAYAKDINLASDPTQERFILLSPADLDEATSSMLDQVGKPDAFGARGTTGLDRIQAFVTGYRGGLSVC
jgi:predicted metalloprotease